MAASNTPTHPMRVEQRTTGSRAASSAAPRWRPLRRHRPRRRAGRGRISTERRVRRARLGGSSSRARRPIVVFRLGVGSSKSSPRAVRRRSGHDPPTGARRSDSPRLKSLVGRVVPRSGRAAGSRTRRIRHVTTWTTRASVFSASDCFGAGRSHRTGRGPASWLDSRRGWPSNAEPTHGRRPSPAAGSSSASAVPGRGSAHVRDGSDGSARSKWTAKG